MRSDRVSAGTATVIALLLSCGRPEAAQQAGVPIPDLRSITAENRDRVEREAIQYLRAVRASDIERALPGIRFDRWLASVLGDTTRWEMNDCGRDRRAGDGAICIAIAQPSRAVDLLIAIGTTGRGIVDRPQMVGGGIRLFDIDSPIGRLAELPDLLSESEARRLRFTDHPMRTLTEADLTRIRTTVRASALEAGLPDEPFEAWLQALLPSDAPTQWALTSCSGIPNAAAPQCVNVDARWSDGARLRILLDLEMVQRELATAPSFRAAFVYRGPPARGVEAFNSLRDFEDVVRALAAQRRQ